MSDAPKDGSFDFDVAVTFAGEDRALVEDIVRQIRRTSDYTVFYDEDEAVEMWGADLTEYFSSVYQERSRFAVMFVSKHYAEKAWTRLERRTVLARALAQETPYLLPVRLDSTALPGVRSSVGYLDGLRLGADGIAEAIMQKLGTARSSGQRRFNGRVPRTPFDVAVLLGERPPAWEYLYLAHALTKGIESLENEYADHRIAFAIPTMYIPAAEVGAIASRELTMITSLSQLFERLLSGDAQDAAVGLPGEPGDPALIDHFASRLVTVYSELLAWSRRLRSYSTPSDQGSALLLAIAAYASQPIEEIQRFVADFQTDMDTISERLELGENINASRTLTFNLPASVSEEYERAFRAFKEAQE